MVYSKSNINLACYCIQLTMYDAALSFQDISRTQRENIYCQAGFGLSVYRKMQTVMNMYEDGDLKDQKLSKKQLTTVPEFKQYQMQPLHNLQASFQSTVLQKVIDKEISLKEMKDEADNFRSLEGNTIISGFHPERNFGGRSGRRSFTHRDPSPNQALIWVNDCIF